MKAIQLFGIILMLNILSINSSKVVEGDKLKVTIYYEALCRYCVNFIKNQLYPAYGIIGDRLVLDFQPYGNVKVQKENDTVTYICQHGWKECTLNKIQACGLVRAKNDKAKMEFVHCVQNNTKLNYTEAAEKCVSKLNGNATEIVECADGKEGNRLFDQFRQQKASVKPPIRAVPTIVFNGNYDGNLTNAATENFLRTACSLFQTKPACC